MTHSHNLIRQGLTIVVKVAGFVVLVDLLFASAAILAQQPEVIVKNGGWCWFQGERALGSQSNVFLTSIAGVSGHGGREAGDLVATRWNPSSHEVQHFVLHSKFQADDHAVAGICLLNDGRLLAVYGKHGNDQLQRWRITQKPNDIAAWTPEQSMSIGAGYTYSNVYRLTAENQRIYNFHRGLGFNPNCNLSDDQGLSWKYGWRLVHWDKSELTHDPRYTGLDGGRPYVRYASNAVDTIHFLMTDDHPRAYDNSLYHGYYRSGKLYRSDGSLVSDLQSSNVAQSLMPRSFTEIFQGNADRVAWCSDIRLDQAGQPVAVFSVQLDDAANRKATKTGGANHDYYYARWLDDQWQVERLAHAGSRLYAGEDDYTGLVSIDPADPNTVVISTNVHPESNKPLISSSDNQNHWEVFLGQRQQSGQPWKWVPITQNSEFDNLRPVIVPGISQLRVILWCRGSLKSYTNYQLDVVAISTSR